MRLCQNEAYFGEKKYCPNLDSWLFLLLQFEVKYSGRGNGIEGRHYDF